jgi:hypothetical protein
MIFEEIETLGNNQYPHRFIVTTKEIDTGVFQSEITFDTSYSNKLIGQTGSSIKEAIHLARNFAREITASYFVNDSINYTNPICYLGNSDNSRKFVVLTNSNHIKYTTSIQYNNQESPILIGDERDYIQDAIANARWFATEITHSNIDTKDNYYL